MAHLYMPISISLENRKCLVVGGGKVALRKVENLMEYQTEITVIAPEVHSKIQYFGDTKKVNLIKREYQSPEAVDYGLVISATDNNELNKKVYQDSQTKGVPVNVVDDPKYCDFLFPAVMRRESLSIAVTTDSKAPFLSAHLRLILEGMFDEKWSKIAKYAEEFRKLATERWANNRLNRTKSLESFINADWKNILEKVKKKEINIRDEFEKFLNQEASEMIVELGPDEEEQTS